MTVNARYDKTDEVVDLAPYKKGSLEKFVGRFQDTEA